MYAWPKFHGSSPYSFRENDLNTKSLRRRRRRRRQRRRRKSITYVSLLLRRGDKNDVSLCKLDIDIEIGKLYSVANSIWKSNIVNPKVYMKKYLSWVWGVKTPVMRVTVWYHEQASWCQTVTLVTDISIHTSYLWKINLTSTKDTYNLPCIALSQNRAKLEESTTINDQQMNYKDGDPLGKPCIITYFWQR